MDLRVVALGALLFVAACGPDAASSSNGSASTRASGAPSASAAASIGPSATAEAERAEAEEKARALREKAGLDADDPAPTGPALTPNEANVDALVAGGPALSSLPQRSTDKGQSFDHELPERLKPTGRAPRAGPAKCPPGDPLCTDL